jgi:hypothetical protein
VFDTTGNVQVAIVIANARIRVSRQIDLARTRQMRTRFEKDRCFSRFIGGKATEHEASEKSEEQQADEILRPLLIGHGGIAKSRRALIFRRCLRIIGRRSQAADRCQGKEHNCAHQGGNNPHSLLSLAGLEY